MVACELMRTVIGDRLRRLGDIARADAPRASEATVESLGSM
jgi:hypothetical protein